MQILLIFKAVFNAPELYIERSGFESWTFAEVGYNAQTRQLYHSVSKMGMLVRFSQSVVEGPVSEAYQGYVHEDLNHNSFMLTGQNCFSGAQRTKYNSQGSS